MPTTANEQFDYIRIDTGGGVFTNRDLEARSITGTSFAVLEGSDDFLYLGDDGKFDIHSKLFYDQNTNYMNWNYFQIKEEYNNANKMKISLW